MTRITTESSADAPGILRARPQAVEQSSGATPGIHPLGLGGRRDGAFFVPDRLDPSKPAPLIVAFHGAGGIASQMIDFLHEPARENGIIVLAPESRSATWDVIRGGYGPDVAFIDEALKRIFQLHAVNLERIAVSGFSDGASYALSLGLINGGLFSDILAFSPGFMAPTQQADTPRIFISHGVRDEVLPVDPCSRRLVPALRRLGYDVDYQEFDGGHFVPADMVDSAIARFLG